MRRVRVWMVRGSVLSLALLSLGCGPLNRGSGERAMIFFTSESIDQADVYAVISGSDAVYVPRSVFVLPAR